ncbi:MAG: hypothetical protein LUG91_00285 [Ruminococcus sp.]|nr:hypothetical protein [Ruminococcus sp.]
METVRVSGQKGERNKKDVKKSKYNLEVLFTKPVRIYIDTCSLLKANSVEFIDEISIISKRRNQKITLFKSVVRELEKVSKEQPYMKKKANTILRKLYELKNENLLEMIEGSEEIFSDPNFLEAVIKDIRKMNIVIISNDSKLTLAAQRISKDILPAVHTKYRLQVMAV